MADFHRKHQGQCPFRKLIRHTIKPPTVRNDDVGRRLLEIVLPFQVLAVAQIAIQDYPFPVTGVCAPAMIIIEIAGQNSCQMTIVQHDDMIQAISPDAANHALHKCILPGASRRSEHLFNAHALDTLLGLAPIDSIPVPQ